MSYSSVGWNSTLFKPTQKNYLYLLVVQEFDYFRTLRTLYTYNFEMDRFEYGSEFIKRKDAAYWAYVPLILDLNREGKQSQIPEEK